MLDWLSDLLIGSLPLRVQLGCMALVAMLILALLAWAYWSEAW